MKTNDAAANTGTTYTLNMGDIVQGSLTLGDRDFYRVNLVAGQTYTFSLVGTGVNNVSDHSAALHRRRRLRDRERRRPAKPQFAARIHPRDEWHLLSSAAFGNNASRVSTN